MCSHSIIFLYICSAPLAQHTAKRRKISYQQLKTLQTSLKKVAPGSVGEEQTSEQQKRAGKIELKVPSELVPTEVNTGIVVTYIAPVSSTKEHSPPPVETAAQLEEEAEGEKREKFISLSELNSNRLTEAG